jgi:putative transposase
MGQQGARKTYKYQLMPTPDQEQALATVLWRGRELYNAGLEERKAAWEKRGVSVNFAMQSAQLPGIKDVRPEYRDINAQVLQDVLHRLDKSFQAFFRRVQAGERPGYPRFQGKDRYNSFTYPQVGTPGGAVLDGGILSLLKIGRLPIRLHRPLEGTPKTVTVSREADGWYACISCADVPTEPLLPTGRETGIDVGLKVFLITADGDVVDNPRHYRRAERYLVKCQRRVSKRKKGSHRRRKAVRVLARAHQTVQRQRRDFHHKTALDLVRHYDTLYVEAIQPANLSRRPAPKPDGNGGYEHNGARRKAGLNKSIQDAGWRHFLTTLAFKAACAGKRVEAVSPAYTTQECSHLLADGTRCGERVAKSLSVRTHICPKCGYVADRDENAARNIQWAGQALRGLAGMPAGRNREAPSLWGWGACHPGLRCGGLR